MEALRGIVGGSRWIVEGFESMNLPQNHAPAVSADKASVVPAGKTSVVPAGKTSAVSADKTSAVSQDIPLLWRTQGGAFGAPLCCPKGRDVLGDRRCLVC